MTDVAGTVTTQSGVVLPPQAAPTPRRQLLRGVLRDRTGVLGLVVVTLLSLSALLAPVLAPHDPNAVDVSRKFLPPSHEFRLGTDHLGRDVLSRLLYGGRLSIGSTLLAGACIALIGLVVGMLAGYLGGIVDVLVSRLIDIVSALPTILLALAITAVLGTGLRNVVIAIVAASWPTYARVVRSAVLAEREKDYVESARAAGASTARVFRRHLLPNIVGPVVVITTLELGIILLQISALSFLGLGVRPPAAEWGAMLSEGRTYLSRAPNMMLFPGGAIFLMVLGFNLLGDGLRDLIDPRLGRGPR
jgi:peptide/nickel transport system permease protein